MAKQNKIEILILDDEKQFTEELCGFFQDSHFVSYEANTAAAGKAILSSHNIDLLILDVRLPGANGLDILKEVKEDYPSIEVIMISAHGDMDTVIKAIQLGAFDYLRKPFRFLDIQIAIERTQKFLQLQRRMKLVEEKNSLITKNLEQKINREFIGVSPQILDVYEQAMTAAKYPDANVLITGESGTGKENVARIIHYSSLRNDHLLCSVNSSAITETLLESEFFGHKKGSFTGAFTDKMGYFEVSNGSTLFLDEIADMPMSLQAKILRALEEKMITRVGDTKPIETDFRIISATNHDILQRVEKKKIRLDLLHRLNTLHIHIPPLRERPEDIKPLLIHFVEYFSVRFNKPNMRIDKEVYSELMKYDFPGNVRELRNLTERAIILCKGNVLGLSDFSAIAKKKNVVEDQDFSCNLQRNEILMIQRALKKSEFNQQLAADELGIHRDALSRKMKKYNISITKN
ncbi:MAG: sigma-54 dependent transcriptional regulator [Bacteroidota bacterium]